MVAVRAVDSVIARDLGERFPGVELRTQSTFDDIPTVWIPAANIVAVCRHLRDSGFEMLFDLAGVDERLRTQRQGLPDADFTVVYHLWSFARNTEVRLKVALSESSLSVPSVVEVWPGANWYEREAWDMYGIRFEGHPHLARILLPPTWEGHALRKDHPARATEMAPFQMTEDRQDQ